MASSMITGEQRWASKRRGGMTVLGKVAKVAVPKPLNLPSQRLENHGLDPTVEIVPKGTLSWGSRPSSASSNAWATSTPSPSTDVSSSLPSHLAGRPLSGSGTRPLTAGSEKAHDSNVSSRPSSASGVLGSNHTSLASLRPRSAENRPGSSQLSRFAEPSPEGFRALGATASSERMGASEGFSLSSGDFPTLGSEKDESRRDLDPLDSSHGRPGSSSGAGKSISNSMEITHDDTRDSDIKGHSWRNDRPPFVEDGPRPSMDRWHGDPHLFQNPNVGPPHYDNWRGAPPANPQGGVWYRGPPGPPHYGGPIPSGPPPYGSPFPYFRPRVASPILANSQPILPPGTGHHGHHPKNGDMYRPHIPESFMHLGVPMRPGFYPPPVPYEGYYRPPMGYRNPNDRDFPFMGMNSGPANYNRPINQNAPDLSISHGRGPDEIDLSLLHHPRGNHNVSVNPNDGWNQSDKEKWGQRVTTDGSNHEKGILSKVTSQDNVCGDDQKPSKRIIYDESTAKDEVPSQPHYSKFSGNVRNVDEPGRGPARDDAVSSRDPSLIQTIQGLNAKARSSGGSQGAFHREEQTGKLQVDNVLACHSVVEGGAGVILERHLPTGVFVPVSRDTDVASEKNGESVMITASRGAIHGAQNRANHHLKGNFDGQESSEWGRNSQSHSVRLASSNFTANDQVEDHNSAIQPSEVRAAVIEMKADGESTMPGFDRTDTQRAKMRELAKQRAIQLQKEEEERIREQKAKALAKLEELNRRSAIQGAEVPTQKELVQPQSTTPLKPDDSVDQPDLELKSTAGSSSIIPKKVALINESCANKVQSSADDTHFEDAVLKTTLPQVCDVSKNKRASYKPKQGAPPEKNLSQMSIIVGQIDVLKNHKLEIVNQDVKVANKVDGGVGEELPEKPLVLDLPAPHKKMNNKSGKNKQKVDDSPISVSSTVSPNNLDLDQAVSESGQDEASRCSNTRASSTLQGEDVHGRVNNSLKGKHSRKPRSSHGNRLSEKAQSNDAVVWAPVRSHNKVENTERTNQKAAELFVSSAIGENRPRSSSKTKRAEMERYVPKPVVKELAQQGSAQQPSVSVDFPIAQSSQDSSGLVERDKVSQGFDSGASSVMKDQLQSGRGKGQPFKGRKGNGNKGQNSDPKLSNAGLMDSHCDAEINHREKTQPSKENRAVVDRSTPHWQPKSQVYVAHNQQGIRTYGGQNHMAQDNQGLKPDIASGSGAHSQSQGSLHNQSAEKNQMPGFDDKAMQDMGHQETKREKRGPHFKGRPHTPSQEKTSASQGVEAEIEPVSSEGAERRNEQRPSSGYRKNSTYGGRFSKVHEPRGDWSTMAPESRQHYSSGNTAERQRQSSHYEYQSVGPYNINDSGSHIENQREGPKFRERGHSRRGRGNFHERQNGINE